MEMSHWFSEFHVRTLAERIAPRIAPAVEVAILSCVRAELPLLLMDELRRMLPDSTPKGSNAARRARDDLIRARYTGRNAPELAAEFCLHVTQIRRIVRK
jgi:hypothetical protein